MCDIKVQFDLLLITILYVILSILKRFIFVFFLNMRLKYNILFFVMLLEGELISLPNMSGILPHQCCNLNFYLIFLLERCDFFLLVCLQCYILNNLLTKQKFLFYFIIIAFFFLFGKKEKAKEREKPDDGPCDSHDLRDSTCVTVFQYFCLFYTPFLLILFIKYFIHNKQTNHDIKTK